MRSTLSTIAAVFAATSQLTSAHFTFVRIAHNGVWQPPLRYMRNKTAPFEEQFSLPGHGWTTRAYNFATVYPDYPESVRCGRDNVKHAAETDVLDVVAGDNLEFAHVRSEPQEWSDKTWNCEGGAGACYDGARGFDVNHWGPLIVHLSKVPDGQDIHTYDGSGEWVKIYTLGFKWRPEEASPVAWGLYNGGRTPSSRYTFRIPPRTPSGQYLVRVDMVAAGVSGSTTVTQYAQLYPSCAQINVKNKAGANALPKGVKFPNIMAPNEPGMQTSDEMYGMRNVDKGYAYPGGPIRDGEKSVADYPDMGF